MKFSLLLTAAVAGLVPQFAYAQDAAPQPVADAADQSGEIVVTAQKRSQSISSVGMSITAATGDALQTKGVSNISDLTRIEPSFQYSRSQNDTPIFTIRGVGYYEQSLAATPTVSIYQDEVPYPLGVMARGSLLDVEHVEVLKGPQGTLFGQNATGGAVNFVTAKPTDTLSAGFDVSFERFGRIKAEGFISGPLAPNLTARLSGSVDQGGAWQKSRTRGDELGDRDTQIVRLRLDWEPTDRLKVTLNANGWRDKSDAQAWQLSGIWFANPQNISPNNLTPIQANFVPQPQFMATYPAPILAILAQPLNPNDNRQADWAPGTRPRNDADFYQGSLRIAYEITDGVKLTSLTSYQHYRQLNRPDLGGINYPYAIARIDGGAKSFFQEVRLSGDLAGGKGNWILGANYAKDKNHERDFFDPLNSSVALLTGGSLFSLLQVRPFSFGAQNDVDAETKAVFAHLEYPLVPGLTLNTGIRYTKADQKFAGCSFDTEPLNGFLNAIAAQLAAASGAPAPTPVAELQCNTFGPAPTFQPGIQRTTLNEDNVAWRAGLDWKPSAHTLVYAAVSKGYKAGASPSLGATTAIQLKPVTQESVLSYEVGVKSTLADGAVQVTASAFHYDYTNKQVLGRVNDALGIFGAVQALQNIPKSRVNGAELTVVLKPVEGLTLSAAGTYLDSKVTKDFINYSTFILSPTDTINFKGEPFPYTPKWSVQYGARYDWSLSSHLNAFVRADASYQSSTTGFFGASRNAQIGAPSVDMKAYSLLNLGAGLETADGAWQFEVYGRNVTNTYYWSSAFWSSDMVQRIAGDPPVYGLRVRYRY